MIVWFCFLFLFWIALRHPLHAALEAQLVIFIITVHTARSLQESKRFSFRTGRKITEELDIPLPFLVTGSAGGASLRNSCRNQISIILNICALFDFAE